MHEVFNSSESGRLGGSCAAADLQRRAAGDKGEANVKNYAELYAAQAGACALCAAWA